VEILHWIDKKNEYISWYENTLENKSEARIEIGKVIIQKNNEGIIFEISDAFGKDIFTEQHLESILSETVL
jgi:hypothetical protein